MTIMDDELRMVKPMPLEGIRVVEFGTFHAGPGASAILGDLGAEVIKIEEAEGDPMRNWKEVGGIRLSLADGEGFPFQFTNRNKRGIWLDIKQEKGREIFHRLIKGADVFLTNLRKSTKKSFGIDYETLSEVNPRLIHASVSGFGQEGHLSDLGAFDPMGQARSGMMFSTGSDHPRLVHLAVLDQTASIALSQAILTALFARERRGVGQAVHISLYGTALWMQYAGLVIAGCLSQDSVPKDRRMYSPLRNYYCCQDGKWIIGTHHPEQKYWPLLCEATGQTELLHDPRFADITKVVEDRPLLVDRFDRVFATKERSEWITILRAKGLMFGPVQKIEEVIRDPQALSNGYVVDFEHRSLGNLKIPGYPVQFSASRAGTRSCAPAIGEHTDAIMREIGYSDQEIAEARQTGVVR
jgi:crotonobetainyl-CoA:carnitine CoA-transferase CaiB-like acyl-CoA transferase